MPKTFSKPILSYSNQVGLLKQRGLSITDDAIALHILSNVSYYRLSGYWYPLLTIPKESHIFKEGATLKDAFDLYCFDRELRKLILAELEKIEVGVKTKMIHSIANIHGPFWYANPTLFKDRKATDHKSYQEIIKSIEREYNRSDEAFIKHFKKTYSDLYPPCWIMFEIISFGTLSMLYQNLKDIEGRLEIPQGFGLSQSVFTSWLHCLVYLRNVCAHHSRVWNRKMRVKGMIPNKPMNSWITKVNYTDEDGHEINLNDKVYFYLCIMVYLLNTINPKHTLKKKFFELLSKYPKVDVKAMGFPSEWEDDPFWQLNDYRK
jgi:abortive infection bacteriophage resistance protein